MAISNGVLLQPFQWYTPRATLYQHLIDHAAGYAARGYTGVWFPPPGKGSGGENDVGYGAFDLFDLGEFDQKGTIPTKYGTRQQLIAAVAAVRAGGMQAYLDTVFNHKDGGDPETVQAQEVKWDDRNSPASGWYDIQAFTRFEFPNRAGKYSTMKWHWYHFDAVSYNGFHPEWGNSRLYRLKDKTFSTEVSPEHGNYDYLMASDLDTSHPEVDGELRWWGRWIIDTTGADGFRIDACKHIRAGFFRDWLNHLRVHFGGRELFSVGEYWSPNVADLHEYLRLTESVMSLFDVPLHQHFHDASNSYNRYDMRTIFDNTLVGQRPDRAVTFVDNHDTQPLQSLESWVEDWFKPLAYALILLRRDGYPCVFAGDLSKSDYDGKGRDGNTYHIWLNDHSATINTLLRCRRDYGFGDQHDYVDHPNTIGWTRLGTADHPGAMAVVLTNGSAGNKWMNLFRPNATFADALNNVAGKVVTNADGWGNFPCAAGSVSVWLQE
jgi:alpha-amylase